MHFLYICISKYRKLRKYICQRKAGGRFSSRDKKALGRVDENTAGATAAKAARSDSRTFLFILTALSR